MSNQLAKPVFPSNQSLRQGAQPKELSKHFLSRLYQEWKKLNPEEYSWEAFKQCVKKARGYAGGKTKADNKMKTSELFFIEERKFAEGQTNWMIGFYLNEDTAAKLAIPGGEAVENLHVTLCYLGELSMYDRLSIARALVRTEEYFRWCAPLVGEVSGVGTFQMDDTNVFYASVDVPGLNELRASLVSNLAANGIKPKNEHGFDPHITLAYLPLDAPTPEWNVGGTPIRFDTATIALGDERIDVQMKGDNYNGVYYNFKEGGLKGAYELAQLAEKNHGLTRIFMEIREFAEEEALPDWIAYLPSPGKYTSPFYGEILITRERNERFAENFNKAIYQERIPIDCEHETKVSGACGWITEMRVNDDGSVDARVEWTDRGIALIESERFKYFSPEWFESWSDPVTGDVYSDVAIGGALTTRPFFKEKALRPLIANEKGLFEVDGEVIDQSHNINFSTTALIPITAEGHQPKTQTRGTTKMSDKVKEPTPTATAVEPVQAGEPKQPASTPANTDEGKNQVSPQQFAEMQRELAEAKTAAETNRTAAETAQAEAKKANERVAALEQQARNKRFTEQAQNFFGDTAKHVSFMEKLAEKFGENSEELKEYVEQQTATAAQLESSDLFKEKGRSGVDAANSAVAMAEAKAKALMDKDVNLSKANALSQVFAEDPKLYERYAKESSVRSSAAGGGE